MFLELHSGTIGVPRASEPLYYIFQGFREHGESVHLPAESIFCIVIFLSWIATPAFGAAKPRGFASSM